MCIKLELIKELYYDAQPNKSQDLHSRMFVVNLTVKGKGKAIPLQTWTGPKGSRRLRLPDFKTIGT